MQPDVTVAIPAHGHPEVVLELLRALAAPQRSGERLPVIISDDASPQPLEPVLRPGCPAALDLRVVRDERNGGPGAARNRALALVDTEWVAFIDADELPAPGWLDRLLELVSAPDAADVIVGRVEIPSAAGPFEHATEANTEEQQYVAGNVAFRTAQLRADGGFDERFYDAARRLHFREDAELRFRLEAAGRSVTYAPDLVVVHPPLPASLLGPAKLARRYYFDPLLSREHPERFREFVRSRRVGPIGLRRARHDSALVFAAGGLLALAGLATGSRPAARAGLAAVTPLVYLWHFYRGVIAFRHHPRW